MQKNIFLNHFIFQDREEAENELPNVREHVEALTNGQQTAVIKYEGTNVKIVAMTPRQEVPSDVPEGTFRGNVKFFNNDKGYGFIEPSEGGGDVFFHIYDVEGQMILEDGQPIEYALGTNNKGICGKNIKPAV